MNKTNQLGSHGFSYYEKQLINLGIDTEYLTIQLFNGERQTNRIAVNDESIKSIINYLEQLIER